VRRRGGRPRALGEILGVARAEAEPATLLAAVQGAWRRAVGERVAAEATPVREREGVITVACRAATWAQELDLLQSELLAKLNAELERGEIAGLRFVVAAEEDFDTH
jgi:predicted nucleic acid-binding Zn ribbon protein